MKNVFVIKKLLAVVVLLTITSCKGQSAEKKEIVLDKKQPNILLILCDDLGYADVGFNGSKDITTPNLDALASKGTIFNEAYVAHPFCGPSRASLLTGRYAHKIGSQFNLPTEGDESKGIDVNETYISKVLQQAGYYTGVMGKWHLGYQTEFHPNTRGFDDFYGFLGGGHNYFPEQFKAAYKRQKDSGRKFIWDYLRPLEHNGKEVDETEYITDALSRETIRFIDEASKKEKPFFTYLSYNAPHTPLEAKEEDLERFKHIEDKKRKTYAAMVYAVDRGVGKIVEKLKETGQYDNTLIIFFSDNGGKVKAGANNFPLTDGKGSAHEGGFRVPMFFHWPNVVPSGKTFSHPVSALDMYPTLAALGNAAIPEGKLLDGKNIWKDFLNNKNPRKDEALFIMRHRKGFSDVAVRKNEWKALKVYQKKWKLFNIEKDLSEKQDLSTKHPEVLKNLIAEGQEWSKTHVEPLWFHIEKEGEHWRNDKMPRFKETFKLD
ncbi:sulfatase-like hydrolase/transferase [Seonamhaeicola marinus]|uniref:Sulfatase-like hydrolase/transferase n=1 Tax=Seonamhaeicola marinus TaxID=1912246 RepID=A0A5D0J6Z9_9FLAO|nr:sulfatase-like hydrolase/transferase [Seonamhaeicola marinus]TYA92135.1 sulfatase-like hydrolase/transferase [Seonamhaeicola marinus]